VKGSVTALASAVAMSRGATARLFVAVDPPAPVCERLADWARRVQIATRPPRAADSSRGALRLLDIDSLHLTLCFLGSRPVGEIEALVGVVGSCTEQECELAVAGPLWLPARRPHALAVEIHDRSGALAGVRERLNLALARASGCEPLRRRFRPHITLARVRGGAAAARRTRRERSPVGAHGDAPSWAHAAGGAPTRARPEQPLPATPQLRFTPPEVVLYRSWLAPEGAVYEALARGELTAEQR